MRVVFVGGGTGGHINPALAIAGYLKRKEPDADILYIGAKGHMEEKLVPAAGLVLKTITISGFQRKLTPKNLAKNVKTVINVFTSSAEARKILKEFRPDICVGTGGYVSGPVIREAVKMHIPCVMHESNAFPGVTTKLLATKVNAVLLAVADAKEHIDPKARCIVTGNPVRGDVLSAEKEESKSKLGLDARPLVLSFGGSLGAQALNSAVAEMLALSAVEKKYQHIHGYGRHDGRFLDDVRSAGIRLEENPQIRLLEYIDNMSECLSAADLVIGRAGAMTLTEIESKAKPSILIPSPNVAENHQYHNAMALERRGATVVIEEKDLTGRLLWDKLKDILEDPAKLKSLGENAGKMDIKDAHERIYREIKAAASGERPV